MNISKIIQELNQFVSEKFDDFKCIYFYGSRVRGDSREDSDIDVIIIFGNELNYKEERELAGIIGELDYKYNVFIDYHPMTMNELEKNPVFYAEVVNKGIFYDAA